MRQPITFAVVFIIAFTTTLGQPLNNGTSKANSKREELPEGTEAAKALARLGDLSRTALRERLQQMRPPAYQADSLEVKKIIEAQRLPVISGKQVDQLKAALQPVLAYHGRSQMPMYVVRAEQPKAYLINHAVIIVTTRMMEVASEHEIRGIVAHELAHEYVWVERAEAKLANDEKRMREFELFCDAVAVFTLKEIGDDPIGYSRILERLAQSNTVAGIMAGNTTRRDAYTHPSLDARKKLIKFLGQQLK